MQNRKKSKIIVIGIVSLLLVYGVYQFLQSNKQKAQIIKHDMMIGNCAMSKVSTNSNKFGEIKTHEDIASELQSNKILRGFFKECEKEFKTNPKEFRDKWNLN